MAGAAGNGRPRIYDLVAVNGAEIVLSTPQPAAGSQEKASSRHGFDLRLRHRERATALGSKNGRP
jgi:hypothetical protein